MRIACLAVFLLLAGPFPGATALAASFHTDIATDGLPVGLQAIGPFLEDRTTITFAALAEQAFGGFVPQPAAPSAIWPGN